MDYILAVYEVRGVLRRKFRHGFWVCQGVGVEGVFVPINPGLIDRVMVVD